MPSIKFGFLLILDILLCVCVSEFFRLIYAFKETCLYSFYLNYFPLFGKFEIFRVPVCIKKHYNTIFLQMKCSKYTSYHEPVSKEAVSLQSWPKYLAQSKEIH